MSTENRDVASAVGDVPVVCAEEPPESRSDLLAEEGELLALQWKSVVWESVRARVSSDVKKVSRDERWRLLVPRVHTQALSNANSRSDPNHQRINTSASTVSSLLRPSPRSLTPYCANRKPSSGSSARSEPADDRSSRQGRELFRRRRSIGAGGRCLQERGRERRKEG